eukprot:gene20515-22534_t
MPTKSTEQSNTTAAKTITELKTHCKQQMSNVQRRISAHVPVADANSPISENGFLLISKFSLRLHVRAAVARSQVRTNNTTEHTQVMLGGSKFQELFGNPDNAHEDHIKQVALNGIKETLGIATKPMKCLVFVQKNCIPR